MSLIQTWSLGYLEQVWVDCIIVLFCCTFSLSFSASSKIDFRNRENLNEIVLTHSVAPHQPAALCSISPSVLVYEDTSKNPRQLHWLDCGEVKPRLLGITANTDLTGVQDMCIVESENEKLLIVISYYEHGLIHAYNSVNGQLKWSVPKKIPRGLFSSYAVSGDGNGRIFMADFTNNCIQMFSASDGQYLECLMKRGYQGLGYPQKLRRSETTSSLVVGHNDGTTWSICDIN